VQDRRDWENVSASEWILLSKANDELQLISSWAAAPLSKGCCIVEFRWRAKQKSVGGVLD
jgi:hypothetical protein